MKDPKRKDPNQKNRINNNNNKPDKFMNLGETKEI